MSYHQYNIDDYVHDLSFGQCKELQQVLDCESRVRIYLTDNAHKGGDFAAAIATQWQAHPSNVTWQVYMKFSSAGATVDLKPLVLPAHTGRNTAVSVVLL